jgi:hypothetical protein
MIVGRSSYQRIHNSKSDEEESGPNCSYDKKKKSTELTNIKRTMSKRQLTAYVACASPAAGGSAN